MFAADRTCCVCRDSTRKCEIHHIDDNPSNNAWENLALICKDHHSEAHSTLAFARNLTPELIRLYNESWRAVIRARLSPTGDVGQRTEYQQEVIALVLVTAYKWAYDYLALCPGHLLEEVEPEYDFDIWGKLSDVPKPHYSIDEWKKYRPLFTDGITRIISDLNEVLTVHGAVVPTSIKLAIMRIKFPLQFVQKQYACFGEPAGQINDDSFNRPFHGSLHVLANFSRLVETERKALEPPPLSE